MCSSCEFYVLSLCTKKNKGSWRQDNLIFSPHPLLFLNSVIFLFSLCCQCPPWIVSKELTGKSKWCILEKAKLKIIVLSPITFGKNGFTPLKYYGFFFIAWLFNVIFGLTKKIYYRNFK